MSPKQCLTKCLWLPCPEGPVPSLFILHKKQDDFMWFMVRELRVPLSLICSVGAGVLLNLSVLLFIDLFILIEV